MRWFLGCLIGLLHVSVALAVVPSFQAFPPAREAAARGGVPLVVCIHGTAWQRASRAFVEDVWRSAALRRSLREQVVLAEIGIGQALDEQARQRQGEQTKGWNEKTVKTFPAIQFYSPDGHLLRTIAGEDFFGMDQSPEAVAAQLDQIVKAVRTRQQLLTALQSLQGQPARFVQVFEQLQDLPLDPQQADVAMLKAVDPTNTLLLEGPQTFPGWEFIRKTTAGLADGVDDEEVAAIEQMLANTRFSPLQRCLLFCAKGMLLAAADKPQEAWDSYWSGYLLDPEGPNGRAVLRHGYRTVGRTLRVGLPPDSPLGAHLTGGNLTRTGQATFGLSSRDPTYDDPQKHSSLFAGALQDFAFHTSEEVSPWVVVDLGEVCRVEAIEVVNRQSNSQRAAGLSLWTSVDANRWQPEWQAPAVSSEWVIDLTSAADGYRSARYVKLGLPPGKTGVLHLRAVNVYGLRPGEQPRTPSVQVAADHSPAAMAQLAVGAERLDVDQLLRSLRILIADKDSVLSRECGSEISTLKRYFDPRLWRSRDGVTVTARLLAVSPTEVTLEYQGLPTPIERKRFSPGSERILAKVEAAAHVVADTLSQAEEASSVEQPEDGENEQVTGTVETR
jgi:hypothetical protein